MTTSENKSNLSRGLDRSPVVALLLTQYRGIQTERLVLSTTMRLLWFVLLLVFSLWSPISPRQAIQLFIVVITLLTISYYASVRSQRLEASLRSSLVRLDPALEDFYINALHEARVRHADSFFEFIASVLSRGEDILWASACFYLLFSRLLPL